MKEAGIYQILNRINGKRYIGSAVDMKKRWANHRSDLRRGEHGNIHLQRAWNLYGPRTFAFAVLEYVPDVERLLECEQHYLDVLQPEYNIALSAASPMLGRKHTEEFRRRHSKAMKGRVISEEHRRRISAATKGRVVSAGTREKLRLANLGKKLSPEQREKLREIRQTVSDEARRNMSEAQKRRRAREAANRAA